MNRLKTAFLAGVAAWALSAGPLLAVELARTAPGQEPDTATHAGEAQQPRLPAAQDTHRTGPTQDQAGSGAVPDTPPDAREGDAARVDLNASSAERAERNPGARANDAKE